MPANDLIFIARTLDNMVIDRRRPPLATGYVLPIGQAIVMGNSDTDMRVVPNSWIWNGDNPATFTEAPAVDPGETPPATQAERLALADAKLNEAKAEIAAIRADMGL